MNLVVYIASLRARGFTEPQIIAAVEAVGEASQSVTSDATVTSGAMRQRRYRERHQPSQSVTVTSPVTVRDIDSKKEVEEKDQTLPQSVTPVTPKYPAEFEEVWSLFTRKVGKDEAYRAWLKNRKRVEHITLIAALKAQAKLDVGKEKRFIPHPATWLNAGRWQDEELQPALKPCELSNGQVYVRYGTDAGDAWEQHYRLKVGKPPPRDSKGGWYFPTEFPEHVSH